MMKRLRIGHHSLIAGFMLLGSLGALQAAEVTDELATFRKKVTEEEAKQNPNSPMRGSQLSTQIKLLENLIKRGDYERAAQGIESLGSYGLPPQLQEDWLRLSESLGQDLAKRKAERFEKASAEIDQLVRDTKKICLEAKSPEEVESLLLRCSALQMQGERGGNVMADRFSFKLQGVIQTISNWTRYLDFLNAGDGGKANESLRTLLSNSYYPVLTAKEIESRVVPVENTQMDPRAAFEKIFAGISSPKDLPTVVERINTFPIKPFNQQLPALKNELPRLNAYLQAWKAAQAGDATATLSALGQTLSGFEEAKRYYVPIRAEIESRVLKDKAAAWTKISLNPGESTRAYLDRVLLDLKERADFAPMLEVISFASQLDPTAAALIPSSERQAIEQFMAARRFEKVGDGLAAVTCYRIVVGLSSGKYAPADKAQAALAELQAKYPEAFKNYEGVLSEQIRGLSQQIQILLQNRGMGGPSRPY